MKRKLDASVEASGPHDFAVRISAVRQKHQPRPPHPVPTSVTIAKRPSCGTGWHGYTFDLGEAGTVLFLQMGLDSPNQLDPLQQIPLGAHGALPYFSISRASLSPEGR